jgi:hypothetical protein
MDHELAYIEDGFARIAAGDPTLSALAAVNLASVRASWERARLGEKRLSAAARHTVASAIMLYLGEAHGRGAASDARLGTFAALFRMATEMDVAKSRRHRPTHSWKPPARWKGRTDGPWSRTHPSGHRLTAAHSPGMPGGEWSILVGELPCLYGDDPEEIERRTLALLEDVTVPKRNASEGRLPPFLSRASKA